MKNSGRGAVWIAHLNGVQGVGGSNPPAPIVLFTKPTKGGDMEAYCVKCKTKKEMENPQKVTLKNGKKAIKGICPDCGTSLFRIVKSN